jgi:hypothetical protein
MFGSGQDIDIISDEDFRSTTKKFLLDPSQFVVGNIRHHLPAWKQWFSVFGLTSKATAVLQWSMLFRLILCILVLKCSKGILDSLNTCSDRVVEQDSGCRVGEHIVGP